MINEYFPVFLNLKDKLCLVIGGGKVAERKVENLLKTGAKVKVISPEVTPALKKLVEEGKIEWERRVYKKRDLNSAWLIIAATNNPKAQKEIYKEAEEKRIFCNVVDVPELCSFIVPSTIKRGLLTIAISTSGVSPAVARRLRETLEEIIGEEYNFYLELMKNLRKQILSLNLSAEEKEKKLQKLAMAPIPRYIKYKDFELLKILIEKEGLTFPVEIFERYFPNISSREGEK
ncbi:MAG: bifunctional precorrin-2 dehydrogenase/sirohydrochlorin ferrochelatase [Thermodesulfobacterium sp.]|nr:bifunctional precorrin-2 dehydrogenase/sirohydrochlorin ferrochelatase [Thermodesulfobacterium sp.]